MISGKAEIIKEKGGNPFKTLFVPETYINLSQGIGRLIRSEEDSGSIILLDNRLVSEPYVKPSCVFGIMNTKSFIILKNLKTPCKSRLTKTFYLF